MTHGSQLQTWIANSPFKPDSNQFFSELQSIEARVVLCLWQRRCTFLRPRYLLWGHEMFKTLLPKRHHGWPAQALVEFTLTALVFLLLIVMIIEVGHIMFAYITIQHAAREAARYAVTGQFDPKYADPLAGWQVDRATADPLKSIRPCWPLFWDDAYAPTLVNGADEPLLYEPFRGPRTCSVEEAAIRSMAGLVMNPHARDIDPDYYDIIVSGSTADVSPQTGSFTRKTLGGGTEVKDYIDYYRTSVPEYTGVNAGGSRGYAGDPGKKVIVQIEYRVRVITPLLSNIAPSIKLNSIATMTVETFGGSSLQREAVLPPQDVDPQKHVSELSPPELVVTSLTCPPTNTGGVPWAPNDVVPCQAVVTNEGVLGAGPSTLVVYGLLDATLPSPDSPPPDSTGYNRDVSIPPLSGEGGSETADFDVTLPNSPAGYRYNIYVWADGNAGGSVTPAHGAIEEVNATYSDEQREKNNLKGPAVIDTTYSADVLITAFTVSNTVPSPGDPLTYSVTVKNGGPHLAKQVGLTLTPLSGLLTCSTYSVSLGDIPANTTLPPQNFSCAVDPAAVTNQTLAMRATAAMTDPTVREVEPGNNTPPDLSVVVGGVDLVLSESVTPAEVNYSASVPADVVYTITVENVSGRNATGVHVTDVLPGDTLQNISVDAPATGSCSVTGSTVDCLGMSVNAGDTATITIHAQVKPGTLPGTEIKNTSTNVTSNELDGGPADNTIELEPVVTVRGVDIQVSKNATVTTVAPGQTFDYVIRAYNDGPSGADNVVIADSLSSSIQYVSHAVNGVAGDPSYTPGGLWNVGHLDRGTTKTLTITVTVLPAVPAGTVITNRAELSNVAGIIPTEYGPLANYGEVSHTVKVSANLALTKDVTPQGTVTSGDTLIYHLTLTNTSDTLSVTNRSVNDSPLLNAIVSGRLLFVGASASHGSFSASTGQWTGINLNPREVATADIMVIAVGAKNTTDVFTNRAAIDQNVGPGEPVDDDPSDDVRETTIQINWPDPIFINAGNASGNCNDVTWGSEDPTLLRDLTWSVTPDAYWSLTGGAPDSLGDIAGNHFIKNQGPPYVDLAFVAQNLFGCRTRTSSSTNGSSFTYGFDNLVPGTWKLYLAFAEIDETSSGSNLPVGSKVMDVQVSNGTNSSLLLDNFDIVAAVNPYRVWINQPSPLPDYWGVYYTIRTFDVTVNSNLSLDVTFTKVGGSRRIHVNGLGIVYDGP